VKPYREKGKHGDRWKKIFSQLVYSSQTFHRQILLLESHHPLCFWTDDSLLQDDPFT
jgi:hypothetical protein